MIQPEDEPVIGFEVAGLGIATVDILTCVEKLPLADEVFEAVAIDVQGGGPVATALVTLSRLGTKTVFLGSIVEDNWGKMIRDEFSHYGVNDEYCILENKGQSAVSVILVEQFSGKRSILYQNNRLPEFIPENLPLELIEHARILHLEGSFMDAAKIAARRAKDAGTKVSFDGGSGKSWKVSQDILPLVDILIVARRFASQVTGYDDPYKAGFNLLKKYAEFVVITDGNRGCWYLDRQQYFHQPAFLVQVQDTTGAGDVFHGAYLYAYLQGWDASHCVRFAGAAAALKCTQVGGRKGVPDLEQVSSFLNQALEIRL
jgi:sulfofructose kinase